MNYQDNDENKGFSGDPLEPFPVSRTPRERRTYSDHTSSFREEAQPQRVARSSSSNSGSGSSGARPTQRRTSQNNGRKRQSPGGRMKNTMTVLLVLVAVAIGGAFYAIGLASDLFGLNQADRQATVEIPLGTSTAQVSRLLDKAGVIDHPVVFSIYSKMRMKDSGIKAGTYVFNHNMGYDQLIVALRQGDSQKNTVRLTFYEGRSQREIAKMLEEENVCLASEFNEYLEKLDIKSSGYTFANYLPEEKDERFRPLEGYLFPDTYEFFVGENVSSVVDKFLTRFDQMLTEELYNQMKEKNMTLDQVITLASIIQEECSETSEMAAVSSVFHNRLGDSATYPKLQSDVTIFYVEKDIKPYLNINNQALYDQYNTYVKQGLPIGPICNPGLEVIEATLNPEKTNYFFFLTDANGKYYYSDTYEQHLKNLRAAEKVGDSHGIDTQS